MLDRNLSNRRGYAVAEFAGRRIVITGGAGGIGVETARTMLAHGAHCVLVDIDEERLAQARETLGTARIATLQSSLETPEACAAALDAAGGPVGALIHLAGLFERDPFDPNDHGVWNRAIAVNLTNVYDLAVAFSTRYDKRDGPARVVFTEFRRIPARKCGISAVCCCQGGAGWADTVAGAEAGAGRSGQRGRAGTDRHAHGCRYNCRTRRGVQERDPGEALWASGRGGVGDPIPVFAQLLVCERPDDHHRWRDHQRLTPRVRSPCIRHPHCTPPR